MLWPTNGEDDDDGGGDGEDEDEGEDDCGLDREDGYGNQLEDARLNDQLEEEHDLREQDTTLHHQASQPRYPSPPSSQPLPSQSPFIPSAQPVLYPPLSPILDPITPCPSPSPASTEESFTFITPPISPVRPNGGRDERDTPIFATRDDTVAQDDSLLDAVVQGMANVSVAMDRDEAGRWRIKRDD